MRSSTKRGLPELICNTSPIQYLHQLGLLDLLRRLGEPVTVPVAVVQEVEEGRRVGVSLPELTELAWISIARPESSAVLPLVTDLGPGEAEVLALGLERRAAVLVIDDALAREVAQRLRLHHTGTLGILLDAKRAGALALVAPFLDRLQDLGFRVARDTRSLILALAGEAPR